MKKSWYIGIKLKKINWLIIVEINVIVILNYKIIIKIGGLNYVKIKYSNIVWKVYKILNMKFNIIYELLIWIINVKFEIWNLI